MGIATQCLEGDIELRVARRAGSAVQVRSAEPVRRLEPTRMQRLEMARQEDGLIFCVPGPGRRRYVVVEPQRGRLEMTCILVHRPSRSLTDCEQAGVLRPRSCSYPDRPPRNGTRRRGNNPPQRHRSRASR